MREPAFPRTQDAQPTDRTGVAAEVACIYCRSAISARMFEFLSPSRQLVSAACPSCNRTVTMRAAAWRREAAQTLHLLN